VDPGLHHLQAEAERVTSLEPDVIAPAKADDLSLLHAFHRDKLALYLRHIGVARHIGDYEFNNAYQYMINREEAHLQWLESAIVELGGTPAVLAEPVVAALPGKKNEKFMALVAEDSRFSQALVSQWKPRVPDVRSERHRKLISVILGETLEQKRFSDHVTAGQDDLLGRRMAGSSTGDGVMPVRWKA
jgi:hypothetical protein